MNELDLINQVTKFLTAAINILFVGHPRRTSLGVLLGVVIKTLIKVFSPLLGQLSFLIDLSKIATWEYIALGVVILHVQTIRFYILRRGTVLGENEEKAFEIIREAKKRGVPEWRIEKMYLELCQKVLENTELKQTEKEEIKNLLEE